MVGVTPVGQQFSHGRTSGRRPSPPKRPVDLPNTYYNIMNTNYLIVNFICIYIFIYLLKYSCVSSCYNPLNVDH